eukprot:1159004-Pelagomonas_calceolata.AAC.3
MHCFPERKNERKEGKAKPRLETVDSSSIRRVCYACMALEVTIVSKVAALQRATDTLFLTNETSKT